MTFGFDSNIVGDLGSKIVVQDDGGEVFKAEWTGPEIIATQRGNSKLDFGPTALMMSDLVFSGIMVLGLSLGGAIIYRIVRK